METLVGSVQPGPRGSQVGGEPAQWNWGVSEGRREGLLNVSSWGLVMLGKVRVPWMTELLPGGLQWGEVGAASHLPGGGGTALEGKEGPGGCFCPCGPAGYCPHEASQPSHPVPHLEHPALC